ASHGLDTRGGNGRKTGFEIYATIKTTKYALVERILHKTIDRLSDLRVRQTREFFNIEPAVALDIICDITCATHG
ncbi:GIY-YIG nuclease family protein, partial [Duodenibacillus massiliensis]|uniref:GIY-YIG nuclease family protein n=1 Tax=Duodenibacillus massiliensis TaxID=1852381 RepID=UPI0030789F64